MHCNVFYHIHALFLLYLCLIPFLHTAVTFLKETIEFNCATESSWLHGLSLKYNQLTVSLPFKKTEFLPYNSEQLPIASCSARRETLCPPFLSVKDFGLSWGRSCVCCYHCYESYGQPSCCVWKTLPPRVTHPPSLC